MGRTKIKNKNGFTLVELLVGVTIIVILFSIGLASYRNFARRQELQGYIKTLTSDLRSAQQLALSGQKPDPSIGLCDRLNGYSFFRSGSDSYQIRANCSEGERIVKTVDLPTTIVISSTVSTTRFKVLGLGTDLVSDNIITLSSTATGNSADVTIGVGGEIK
jgi:prepilin-type N-terminal cleavage/methylation domain-containing protein